MAGAARWAGPITTVLPRKKVRFTVILTSVYGAEVQNTTFNVGNNIVRYIH